MSLTCGCDDSDADWYYQDADWYYQVERDFSVLQTKQARKCCSCKTRLAPGAEMVRVARHRPPKNAVEERIYGEEHDAVPLADWFLCEACGGLVWAVQDLGFCFDIGSNIAQQVREYMEAEAEYAQRRRGAA